MRKLIFLISILISSEVYSQLLVSDVMSDDIKLRISELKRSSLSIELFYNGKIKVIGSGFLVLKNRKHYAVTNYHVVEDYLIGKDSVLVIGINAEKKKQYALIENEKYFDKKNDIAVMKIERLVIMKDNKVVDSTLLDPLALGVSVFEENRNIEEGLGVLMIGYPLNIGSELTGNRPVSRIGIVAQSVNEESNTFFIDGMSSHGNSGSPVFNIQNKKLVGMIVAFQSDFITAYDERDRIIVRLPYNSGLSYCITAEMINKMIP
jgi:S1-C subfamily serine protease